MQGPHDRRLGRRLERRRGGTGRLTVAPVPAAISSSSARTPRLSRPAPSAARPGAGTRPGSSSTPGRLRSPTRARSRCRGAGARSRRAGARRARRCPESTGPMAAIASTPRSGRDPCAARPSVATSNATKPLCAIATTSSVGSGTIAAVASSRADERPRCRRCRPPRRRRRVTMTSPRSPSRAAAAPTSMIAASGPSCRRHRARAAGRPSCTGVNGLSMPATPTVSMCALSRSEAPPPVPRAIADDVRPSRSGLVQLDLEARLAQPAGDERGDLRLSRPAGERGPGSSSRSRRAARSARRGRYAPSAA